MCPIYFEFNMTTQEEVFNRDRGGHSIVPRLPVQLNGRFQLKYDTTESGACAVASSCWKIYSSRSYENIRNNYGSRALLQRNMALLLCL